MIVTLTHAGAERVIRLMGGIHAEWMVKHRSKHGRTQHDYELPAIAWRQILDEMLDVGFGPAGGKTAQPDSFYTALKRIQAAVTTRERHPALSATAVMGRSNEIIPVWVSDTLRTVYPPGSRPRACLPLAYEPQGRANTFTAFRWLTPVISDVSGQTVTEWVASPAVDKWMPGPWTVSLDLTSQLAFVQSPSA